MNYIEALNIIFSIDEATNCKRMPDKSSRRQWAELRSLGYTDAPSKSKTMCALKMPPLAKRQETYAQNYPPFIWQQSDQEMDSAKGTLVQDTQSLWHTHGSKPRSTFGVARKLWNLHGIIIADEDSESTKEAWWNEVQKQLGGAGSRGEQLYKQYLKDFKTTTETLWEQSFSRPWAAIVKIKADTENIPSYNWDTEEERRAKELQKLEEEEEILQKISGSAEWFTSNEELEKAQALIGIGTEASSVNELKEMIAHVESVWEQLTQLKRNADDGQRIIYAKHGAQKEYQAAFANYIKRLQGTKDGLDDEWFRLNELLEKKSGLSEHRYRRFQLGNRARKI